MVVTIDTETTGLDPIADRLVLVGVQLDGDDHVHVLRHPDDAAQIRAVLALDAHFAMHNATFDLAFLERAGYTLPESSKWIDTTLLAHTAGVRKLGNIRLARLAASLIELGELPESLLEPEHAIRRWRIAARKQARKDGRPLPELGHAPRDLLDPYLAADVKATRAVLQHYGARAREQSKILTLEHRLLPAIYATEQRGVPIDLDAAIALRDSSAENVRRLREQAFDLAGHPFNLGSARQIENALAERGVDLTEAPRTQTGMLMTAAQTLRLIDDELARAIEEFRAEKKLSDYVVGLFKHTHGDRLRGSFHQCGTDTGRMSSSRPNLQNLPKSDLRVRFCVAAGAGKTLVAADLDNVELRVLACYAPGGQLEQAFHDGVDLHQQAADALGIERDQGKRLNYAILYGAGIPKIASILDVARDDAKQLLDRWYATYPEVKWLKYRLTQAVRRRGYITSIGGRRHYFDEPNHMLVNRLISGSCADLFKRSLIALHDADVPAVLYVHDEVVCEVDEDDADRVARLLEAELARDTSRPGVTIEGLVAEAKVAQRWSDFKEPGWAP